MTTNKPMGLQFGDMPSGAKKKLFLAVYVPNGERALIGGTSIKQVAAKADDIARKHKITRTGCRIDKATQADVEAGGFIEIVA